MLISRGFGFLSSSQCRSSEVSSCWLTWVQEESRSTRRRRITFVPLPFPCRSSSSRSSPTSTLTGPHPPRLSIVSLVNHPVNSRPSPKGIRSLLSPFAFLLAVLSLSLASYTSPSIRIDSRTLFYPTTPLQFACVTLGLPCPALSLSSDNIERSQSIFPRSRRADNVDWLNSQHHLRRH
jgi:hypothetical protein